MINRLHPVALVKDAFSAALAVFLCIASFLVSPAALAQAVTTSTSTTWAVTIVLPPKVVAGHQATLAVLGTDGRLAPNVAVELGSGAHVTTDATGRARFVVPTTGAVLLAKASGDSAAALVDPAQFASGPPTAVSVAPVVALHDRFAICGAGWSGDADANRVRINGAFALVVAASPECLVVLPPPDAASGPAKVSVEAPAAAIAGSLPQAQAPMVSTPGPFTLVSLEFAPPSPPLQPGKKSFLAVNARGSEQPLRLVIENETPGVLTFRHGDSQELRTTGGAENVAEVEVQAIRSGDFSFHARVLHAPDVAMALRYLQAASAIAPKDFQSGLKSLTDRLAHHPNDSEEIRRQLAGILVYTIAGDLRTLLDAAHSAL
jgi:hypothetical protein